jgi:hypothetical protein
LVETLRAGETLFVRPVAVLRAGTPCLGLEETATVGMFLSTDASAGILLNHAVVDVTSPMNSTRFADRYRIELIQIREVVVW